MKEVAISDIQIGDRVRKDFGDIHGLAASIEEIGLLQPIGITPNNELVFGERRLRAFQKLNRHTIPARVVDIDLILEGEYAENEFRKDFTVSERVEIGTALETELRLRHGRNQHSEDVQKSAHPETGRTREIAAQKAGFGSHDTYEKAKRVVENALPEIIDAVDDGKLSINLASKVVELPVEDQFEISNSSPDDIRKVAIETVKRAHVANNSGNNEWYTPPQFIEAARAVMGAIDLDPATSEIANETVKAETIFTAETNGLDKAWHGNVWMNPPYAQPLMSEFAEAVTAKFHAREIKQACVLVNNATETAWFQRMMDEAVAICFPRSRIKFLDPDGKPSGAPLQGQAVLYFGGHPDKFAAEFKQFGKVVTCA